MKPPLGKILLIRLNRKETMLIVIISMLLASSISKANDFIVKNTDRLYSEYEVMMMNPGLQNLVSLDTDIRKFVSQLPKHREKGVWGDARYWKEKYSNLGLFIQKYGQELGYSGKFLSQAHKIDPDSKFREHTLYSEILEHTSHGLGQMPNIQSAYQYAREFPEGPFILEILEVIAAFHKDLFMVIRNHHASGHEEVKYKFNCFEPFIDKTPYPEQMKKNKQLAIDYYTRVQEINSNNYYAKKFIKELSDGTVQRWHYCAD